MEEICNVCGLPKNLCVCKEIQKEQQKIKIKTVKRTYGRIVTIIKGLEDKEKAKELEKNLKKKLACGGTLKGNEIELQGNHKEKVIELLIKEGFKKEMIEG